MALERRSQSLGTKPSSWTCGERACSFAKNLLRFGLVAARGWASSAEPHMSDQLLPLPLTERSVHLCVDMQRIFSAEGPWPTPWMDRVLPVAAALAERHPERTIFTRFIPPTRPEQIPAMCQRYYDPCPVATPPFSPLP